MLMSILLSFFANVQNKIYIRCARIELICRFLSLYCYLISFYLTDSCVCMYGAMLYIS